MTQPVSKSLPDCPDTPNCVSSQAGDAAHAVAPLTYTGSVEDAMKRLRAALATEPRITLITERDNYLHAEARSLIFRFVDDVEFLVDPEQKVIHVRSAARTGYSDLGVNRRRVERLRRAFTR
jgi:uncharacterized protein (DUF1499 family)